MLIQHIEQPKAHQETQVCNITCSLPVKLYQLFCSNNRHKEKVLAVQDLVFGASFTDHMFMVEHVDGQGWGQPVIKPFGNISVHPAAQALHYGVCCFEGMKAYLGKDGKARLFRCDCRPCANKLDAFNTAVAIGCIAVRHRSTWKAYESSTTQQRNGVNTCML